MDLRTEAENIKGVIKLMRDTAIELRANGGEPSDNFKRRLCAQVQRLKKITEEANDAQQSCFNGQDNP